MHPRRFYMACSTLLSAARTCDTSVSWNTCLFLLMATVTLTDQGFRANVALAGDTNISAAHWLPESVMA